MESNNKDKAQNKEIEKNNGSFLEPVTICDRSIITIENRIFYLRSKHVMLDRDLADLYEVETKDVMTGTELISRL